MKSTDGAIGYVDFSDAKATGLTFAAVKNQSLKFVTPSVKSASAGRVGERRSPRTCSTTRSTHPVPSAYPITSPTWILAYKTQSDASKGAALKAFLTYILSQGPEARLDRQLRTAAGGPREAGARRREADRLIAG